MVDYYFTGALPGDRGAQGFRGNLSLTNSTHLHPAANECPLNLSLTENKIISSDTSGHDSRSFPNNVTSLIVDNSELGQVFIVSDLDCAIAQEEVVEAVDISPVVIAPIKEEALACATSVSDFEAEELDRETTRNAFLKSKLLQLSEKVDKMREILDSEVEKQKNNIVADAVILVPKNETETEIEIKSECEFESGGILSNPQKRSRNHSWPQMSTITSNQRKKEQNKLASKRFRERKKLELARARQDISDLEARNDLLRTKADSMQTEADNLKKNLLELKLIKIVDLPSGQSSLVKTN